MSKLIVFCSLIFGMLSCNNPTPSGFWTDFQKDYLIENISDQGLNGGHKALYWKSNKSGTFTSSIIIEYATKNGWKLSDSLDFNPRELEKWFYDSSPIFPLSYTGFSSNPTHNSTYKKFPRWVDTDLKVYAFKTPWVVFEPGTDNSTETNGFVILSNRGEEMSVYHLWGE